MRLFSKQHSIPFIEKLPWLWQNSALCKQYFGYGEESVDTVYSYQHDDSIVPALCSEFFCRHHIIRDRLKEASKDNKQAFVCLFVNDTWLNAYAKRLVARLVIYRAIQLNVSVLYVGSQTYEWYPRRTFIKK